MRYYRLVKDGDDFNIFVEEHSLSSPQFQYNKKNFKLFFSYEDALNYVLENSSPEARDEIVRQMEEEKMNKLFEDYMNVKSKSDFENLFDIKLSDESYTRLKNFIEFIKNGGF